VEGDRRSKRYQQKRQVILLEKQSACLQLSSGLSKEPKTSALSSIGFPQKNEISGDVYDVVDLIVFANSHIS
jgi:hypothetical protein